MENDDYRQHAEIWGQWEARFQRFSWELHQIVEASSFSGPVKVVFFDGTISICSRRDFFKYFKKVWRL